MKNYLYFLLLMITISASAQSTWQLFGHYNGKDVRLIWSRSSYPTEVEGIIVKRKLSTSTEWSSLTKAMIYPGLQPTKNVSNVSSSTTHVTQLSNKMKENPKDFTMDSTSFRNLLGREGGLSSYMFILAKDYDYTLISGLGYEDAALTFSTGQKIDYAIFTVVKGKPSTTPVATWSCTIGQLTSLAVTATTSVKARKNKNQIKVSWSLSSEAIKKSKIVYAFHVYRTIDGKRERLTQEPALANVIEPTCKIVYMDSVSNINVKITYELAPISVLGYEMTAYKVLYDPSQFPDAFTPVLASLYKEGDRPIRFSLNIPAQVIPFIDSIRLEESSGASEYYKIKTYPTFNAEMVVPFDTARAFPRDYEFRAVIYLHTEEMPINTSDVKVYFSPNMKIDPVQNITAVFMNQDGRRIIRLKWQPIASAAGYRIYLQDPTSGEMIWEATIGTLTTTQYDYPVVYSDSKGYTFSVSAVDKKGFNESDLKYVATAYSPSKYLLRVWFAESVVVQDSLCKVTWNYNEPADVTGYRLYENGSLITDEQVLRKGSTQWISTPRKPGNYVYQIEAVSLSGVVSPRSEERVIIIRKK